VSHLNLRTQLFPKLFVVPKMFQVELTLFRGGHLLIVTDLLYMNVFLRFQDDFCFFLTELYFYLTRPIVHFVTNSLTYDTLIFQSHSRSFM